jgi:hypothetical protein
MKNLARLFAALATLAAWSAFVPNAQAASVQNTQSGTIVNSANGIQTVTISSVDTTKSVLFFSTRHDSNRPVGSLIRGLASATTIEFERVTDGVAPEPAPIEIRWTVVTWASGVNVQRGEVAQATTTVDVTVPTAVAAVNQAFVLWSKTPVAGDGDWSADDPVVGELTSTTNLQFRVDSANAAHIIAWQVVEFTNAADITVQKGSTSLTGGALSTTATLSPAVNVNKTFVLAGFRTPGEAAPTSAHACSAWS